MSDAYTPHGGQSNTGAWVSRGATFASEPAQGPAFDYSVGRFVQVEAACEAAEDAFWSYGHSSRERRAAFHEAIAEEIEDRGRRITWIGTAETGLPAARLERDRTTAQLRLFAAHIRAGDYLDRRQDPAMPDRAPMPRPEMRMVQRPIGPVAVFAASNFPLAFSTAGGDTAAALAAGGAVVVKGHCAHPGAGEVVAETIHAAIARTGMSPGVFSLIQGGTRDLGAALVQLPLIKAVGFTGSLGRGRALFDLCVQCPEPIAFFGELGAVNPMFLLPGAAESRGEEIGRGWAASLTMGAGQFCTNPGIAVVGKDAAGDAFVSAAAEALMEVFPQVMLSERIAEAYRKGKRRFEGRGGATPVLRGESAGRRVGPALYQTDAATCLQHPVTGEEVLGPFGLVVRVGNIDDILSLAKRVRRSAHRDLAYGRRGCGPGASPAADPRTESGPSAGQRRSDRRRGLRFDGARWPISGHDQLRRHLRRYPLDPPLPSPRLLAEPAGCPAACGSPLSRRSLTASPRYHTACMISFERSNA